MHKMLSRPPQKSPQLCSEGQS